MQKQVVKKSSQLREPKKDLRPKHCIAFQLQCHLCDFKAQHRQNLKSHLICVHKL